MKIDYPELDISLHYLPLLKISPVSLSFECINTPLTENTWLIFTSQNAVIPVLNSEKSWHSAKIASIGKSTSSLISSLGYKVSFAPKIATATNFGVEFADFLKEIKFNGSLFLFQGTTASLELKNILEGRGYNVSRFIVYESNKIKLTKSEIDYLINFLDSSLANNTTSILCVFSSLGASLFIENISHAIDNSKITNEVISHIIKNLNVFAIGPITGNTLNQLGFLKVQVIKNSSMEEMTNTVKLFIETLGGKFP